MAYSLLPGGFLTGLEETLFSCGAAIAGGWSLGLALLRSGKSQLCPVQDE